MRKCMVIVVALFCFTQAAIAQDTIRLKEISRVQKKIVTDRPPQAVYFQLFGSGPVLSVNYDRRFFKKLNGLGFTAGIGYWYQIYDLTGSVSIFSVPVSVNYLAGQRNHYLELAAGTTFITAKLNDFFDSEKGSGFIHHVSAGYRYQPATGGFFFRGGVSPLFTSEVSVVSFYLGFGRNF